MKIEEEEGIKNEVGNFNDKKLGYKSLLMRVFNYRKR